MEREDGSELVQLRQALGLLTTLAPMMEMDCANPIKMAQEIHRVVTEGLKVTGQTSDGYHTFDELYDHRIELWMALCRNLGEYQPWMSTHHSDGTTMAGWFVLGIRASPGRQITYHLPIHKWAECQEFAIIKDKAPAFDGHTSADVLQRLKTL